MQNTKRKRSLKKVIFLCVCAAFLLLLGKDGYAAIIYTPGNPNVEQPVNFTATGFVGKPGVVSWNFGDGTVVNDDAYITHTFISIGTFTVTATQIGETDTGQITVTEKRRIEYNPASPRPTETVTFSARNFFSNSIRWDFGDGTVSVGGRTETHAYTTRGTYTVTATDFGGASLFPIRATIRLRDAPSISYNPERSRVGVQVRFMANNFESTTLIRWDFGDGSITNDTTPPIILHTYSQPGNYQVRAYDNGGSTVTASVSVRVYPKAKITYTPIDPRSGEEIDFIAQNFFSSTLIRWDFGDGTILNDTSLPSIKHAYASPGSYQVRAYDEGLPQLTATAIVTVLPARQILISPPRPKAGEEVTFQAFNYISPSIRWDYGDGVVITSSGNLSKHTYERAGFYQVTVYDFRGATEIPQSVSLTVVPKSGPRAPFSISYINLRFTDGKSYKVIPKGLESLTVEADIKFEGTGVVSYQWIVDGIPFRMDSKLLSFALEDTLDSGRALGLPTLIPGIHEVTIKFIQPQVEFEVPVIRYYVTPEVSKKPPVNIRIVKVMDSRQQEIPLSGDSLEAPSGEYILLVGTLTNEEDRDFSRAILRIYLDSQVVDQQFITEFKSKETQTFQTSIHFTSAEESSLYLILYDISVETPDLLSVKVLSITPTK